MVYYCSPLYILGFKNDLATCMTLLELSIGIANLGALQPFQKFKMLLKNSSVLARQFRKGDGKCLPASRKSLISHPDANQFLRFLEKRVFQHPQAITLRIRVVSVKGMLQQQELPQG